MSSFDRSAASWDTPEKNRRSQRIARQMRALIELHSRPSGGVLTGVEYGAGTGQVGFELAGAFTHLTFVDASRGMVRQIEGKIADYEGATSLQVLQEDAQDRAVPGVFGDVIFLSLSLHHVADTKRLLQSLRAMMPVGGLLIVFDLDSDGGRFHGGGHHHGHTHHGFDRAALAGLLKQTGFKVQVVEDGPPVLRGEGVGAQKFPTFMIAATSVATVIG